MNTQHPIISNNRGKMMTKRDEKGTTKMKMMAIEEEEEDARVRARKEERKRLKREKRRKEKIERMMAKLDMAEKSRSTTTRHQSMPMTSDFVMEQFDKQQQKQQEAEEEAEAEEEEKSIPLFEAPVIDSNAKLETAPPTCDPRRTRSMPFVSDYVIQKEGDVVYEDDKEGEDVEETRQMEEPSSSSREEHPIKSSPDHHGSGSNKWLPVRRMSLQGAETVIQKWQSLLSSHQEDEGGEEEKEHRTALAALDKWKTFADHRSMRRNSGSHPSIFHWPGMSAAKLAVKEEEDECTNIAPKAGTSEEFFKPHFAVGDASFEGDNEREHDGTVQVPVKPILSSVSVANHDLVQPTMVSHKSNDNIEDELAMIEESVKSISGPIPTRKFKRRATNKF